MRIISSRIDWYEHYDNLPQLEITVDKLPEWSSCRFQKHSHGMGTSYWAENTN